MQTSIASTFVIVFREALEAGLIIGIILTVLARLNAKRYFAHVLASVGLAAAASWFSAIALERLTSSARGGWEKLIEGGVSLVACAIVTYMVFWMHGQARGLKSSIESKYAQAVPAKDLAAMVILPFVAVFREGVETVLFLKAVSIQSGEGVSAAGGLAGFALAFAVTLAIFVGGRRVPLKPLFQYTGYFLVFVSAGLLAYGIHELEEAKIFNPIIYPVWNINHILNDKEGVGSFLKALFGYNGNPSLVEVIAYWTYLITVFFLLRRPTDDVRSETLSKPSTRNAKTS